MKNEPGEALTCTIFPIALPQPHPLHYYHGRTFVSGGLRFGPIRHLADKTGRCTWHGILALSATASCRTGLTLYIHSYRLAPPLARVVVVMQGTADGTSHYRAAATGLAIESLASK